jgi:outer membrane receptor for Fe3+-dicitrate
MLWAAITGKISGRVTDQNGEPLPGANVSVEGTNLGAATDIDGNYFILKVPPGTFTLGITMMGYKTVAVEEVRVIIDQTARIDVRLEEAPIEGEEVTIVSERPAVEIDLTASKERVSAEDIATSYITDVKEVLVQQSGVSVYGGVRGGFKLDVTYVVDGQEVRDDGTNQNFISLNKTSIQEMELLTGGWNAEYPNANSGIVNVVTKSASEAYHGSIRNRYRPAGKYHWGRNIYSDQNFDHWEVNPYDGSPGLNSLEYWTTNEGGPPFNEMTPEQRLAEWRQFIASESWLTEYADRPDYDLEATVTGPIVKNLGFMLSGRYDRGTPVFPSAIKYNESYNLSGKLNYDVADNTRIMVNGIYWKSYDGQASQSIFQSSQTWAFLGNPKGWFYSPYNTSKYWPWGGGGYGGGEDLGRLRPPELYKQYTLGAKLTHVFNPSTFLDVAAQFYRLTYHADHSLTQDKGSYSFKEDTIDPKYTINSSYMGNPYFQNIGTANDETFSDADSRNLNFRVDLTSQMHPAHQVKTGIKFSSMYIDRRSTVGWIGERQGNVHFNPVFKPWEANAYFQDKIELLGMVVNAGLRLDMFNVNKKVNYTITDPMALSDHTFGNQGINVISFDPEGRYSVDTKTKVALAPRIGISHPITENTVLHFMYGHFNQRPGWQMIGTYGALTVNPGDAPPAEHPQEKEEIVDIGTDLPARYNHGTLYMNNPALDYERVIQYEVGFEQNIVDVLSIDITVYYKDGKDLTSLGFNSDYAIDNFIFDDNITTWLWSDPYNYQSESLGNLNRFQIPINGGFLSSRGLELSLESRFSRAINFRLVYNMMASLSGVYGLSNYFRDFEDGTKQNLDTFHGGNNGDQGGSGNKNERWTPRNTFKLMLNYRTPKSYGSILGDWYLNLFSEYATGQKFTYHSARQGDFSTEPNNQTWKGYYNTNARLAKVIQLGGALKVELSLDVINLFNQHYLRLPGIEYGSTGDLEAYMEDGTLPKTSLGEDDVWSWYSLNQLPRQLYFGLGFEF